MTRPQSNLAPQDATREIARLKRAFVQRFADVLPLATIPRQSPRVVFWLDAAGRLNHLRVESYLRPSRKDRTCPLVMRISVNYFEVGRRDAIVRWLDQEQQRRHPDLLAQVGKIEAQPWKFELSTLPEEFLDFAPWMASLVMAHFKKRPDLVRAVPHACHFWNFEGPEILRCEYAWTRSAWDVVAVYQKRQAARKVRA